MPAFRPSGVRDGFNQSLIVPGDLIIGGESVVNGALTTVGAGSWTAALITNGIIRRTGPVAGYADTTATAAQIIAALAGNMPAGELLPGSTFRMLFINAVAQAMTLTLGTGVQTGLGTLDCAASLIREYLWTVLNTTPEQLLPCATTNASPTVTFVLPAGMSALPYAVAGQTAGVNISPGCTVSGTGITAGTTVLGVTQGLGGITGVTLSANATATNNPVGLTFGPTMRLDSLGSRTA